MHVMIVAIALVGLLLTGCQVVVPVTSGDDPAVGVPMSWSLNESPRPDGHLVRVYGGTMHSIPSSARLIGPSGQVISSAPAIFAPGAGLCGDTQGAGVAGADLPLPPSNLPDFRSGWPAGYRVEVELGGTWRPASLTYAGCNTAE